MAKESNYAIVLKTMINPFNANDLDNGDELSVSVYSDVVGEMFKCGQFDFANPGDVLDFDDLVVPCTNFVSITLTERDPFQNDGHTVVIPCRQNSD